LAKQKILIIDDSEVILDAFKFFLNEDDYEVILGKSGADGIRLATEQKPDLVILDIVMPDITGDLVLEEIKKRKIPTRVIMISGYYTAIRDVIKYVKAGACDYLIKPVVGDELLNAVKRNLALEKTISSVTSRTTPLINTLMINAEKLDRENDALEQQIQQLQIRHLWINLSIRLIYLLCAMVVTIVFYQLKILTTTQSLFVLPIVLFILLLFPIERIKVFTARHRQSEARVEVEQ
jgi:two-component system, OmpR family, response regulator VicR